MCVCVCVSCAFYSLDPFSLRLGVLQFWPCSCFIFLVIPFLFFLELKLCWMLDHLVTYIFLLLFCLLSALTSFSFLFIPQCSFSFLLDISAFNFVISKSLSCFLNNTFLFYIYSVFFISYEINEFFFLSSFVCSKCCFYLLLGLFKIFNFWWSITCFSRNLNWKLLCA